MKRDPFAPPADLVETSVFSIPRDTLLVEVARSLEATRPDDAAELLSVLEALLSPRRDRAMFCVECEQSVWTRVEPLEPGTPAFPGALAPVVASLRDTHPARLDSILSALREWAVVPKNEAVDPVCPWCGGMLAMHRPHYCPACGRG